MIFKLLKTLWVGAAVLVYGANTESSDRDPNLFVATFDLSDNMFLACALSVEYGGMNAFLIKNEDARKKDFTSTFLTINNDFNCQLNPQEIALNLHDKFDRNDVHDCLLRASENQHHLFSKVSLSLNNKKDALACKEFLASSMGINIESIESEGLITAEIPVSETASSGFINR